MSFASALPANLPKFQIVSPLRRVSDETTGFEYVTTLVRMLADTATTHERYTPYRYYEEVARAVELFAMAIHVLDHGFGISAVPTRIFSLRDRAADASYIHSIARVHGDVTYGDGIFTVGYPAEESPAEDLGHAYLRALQQLSTLRDGRYAYAQDWNVLADYAKAIINVFSDQFAKMYRMGYRRIANLYDKVSECHRILSTYKYLQSGNVVMPEHTNTLIDTVKCLSEVSFPLIDRDVARYLDKTSFIPVDTDKTDALDEVISRNICWTEIVLVDTDDWETAREYITDGTIVFVNYGTRAMTPSEVLDIVNTMNVVFAILIDTQPYYRVDTGAFYGVFYTQRYPPSCSAFSDCFNIIDSDFAGAYSFYDCLRGICYDFSRMFSVIDYAVHISHKVSHAVPWGPGSCGYAYARYGAGAIIELPFNGVLDSKNELSMVIGKIAGTLLGVEVPCNIAAEGKRLRRIVWMASYLLFPYPYPNTVRYFEELASMAGCPLLDLRTH
jgi:hypothetical protein